MNEVLIKMIDNKSPLEAIVETAVAIGEYTTKTEARGAIQAEVKKRGTDLERPKTMADQIKEWYLTIEDPMSMNKDDLKKAIKQACNDIGMSPKSTDWYVRVYMLATEVANHIINK